MAGDPYAGRSKLEELLGSGIWPAIGGRAVLDFGCGNGTDAVEMALRGAGKVIGFDIRERALAIARQRAEQAGVADRCEFTAHTPEPVDVVTSLDAFEHFEDPAAVLATMRRLLKPNGRVFIVFGPPWFHPYGGHLFSVFPWAHLVFSEGALIRWRSEFKSDGATRFQEVEGGLNGMTVRRFERLVGESGFVVQHLEAVPIRQVRRLTRCRPLREFITSIVRCELTQR